MLEQLQNLGLSGQMLDQLRYFIAEHAGGTIGNLSTPLMAALLFVGAVSCFLGYRLLKIWLVFVGATAGFGIAYMMVEGFSSNKILAVGAGILAAGVVGGFSFYLYQAGVFLLCCVGGTVIFSFLFRPTTSFFFFCCILLGAAIGFAGVRFVKPIVIFVTSISGGLLMGEVAARMMGIEGFVIGLFFGIILAAAGIAVQWKTSEKAVQEENCDEEEMRDYEETVSREDQTWEKK